MPLTHDGAVAKLGREFRAMATTSSAPRAAMLEGIKGQGLLLLKHEFATSTSATGDPFAKTVKGKPALLSRKLPFAFGARVDRDSVRFVGRVARDWLDVLATGRTFKARQVAANKQYLSFNSKGKLVRESRLFNKRGELRKNVHQVFAAAHTVGERVLPARPPLPTGSELPPPWEAATKAGVAIAFGRWAERL